MYPRNEHPTKKVSRQEKFVSIVLPAYNEAENLPMLVQRLSQILKPYPRHEILVVDDGSSDGTRPVLEQLRRQYPALHFLSFSRNFGHQAALRAGYEHAKGDCVISLDADGQHPPELIPALIRQWQNGYDVVATKRREDPNLPLFKRITSRFFYKLIRSVSELELEEGSSDFRLLDRKVIDALKQHKEADLFLRGLVSWIGFRQCRLVYEPAARHAGKSKYSLLKMLKLALGGITSFSIRPLFISVFLGFGMSLFAGLFGLEVLYEKYFTNATVSGWTSIILLMVMIGGFQFIMIGIIGVYLGKTFQQVKQRPSYLVDKSSYVDELIYEEWTPVLTESYLQ
ncbi:glycosyltransferase family 2 protein [Tellurirhabdus rosea]|uniref:glycosyltransferase family 2 protein n=1 Tax=Tellurirhabdus rosea TaxID=2674997 RepID=UPI00225798E2|nr:glycosyltransferase family 2 protein [Tellurirhabdus rosea]